jgi:hypothetical protein
MKQRKYRIKYDHASKNSNIPTQQTAAAKLRRSQTILQKKHSHAPNSPQITLQTPDNVRTDGVIESASEAVPRRVVEADGANRASLAVQRSQGTRSTCSTCLGRDVVDQQLLRVGADEDTLIGLVETEREKEEGG